MNYKKEVFILREFTLMNKNTPVLKFELDIDTAQIYNITKVQNPEYATKIVTIIILELYVM